MLSELHEGRTFSELIRHANQDLGPEREVLPTTYWQELHRWKTEIPGFAEAYQAALEACYEIRGEEPKGGPAGAGRPEEFGPELQLAFIEEMMANGGDAIQACYDVGVSKGTVFSRLGHKSPKYDESFALRFAVAEAERGGHLYGKFWEHGLKEDEEGNIRQPLLLRDLAQSRLPHFFSTKRTLEIEGHIDHRHNLLPAGVTRQIAQTSRALLPKTKDPEEVVDAEYVEAEG